MMISGSAIQRASGAGITEHTERSDHTEMPALSGAEGGFSDLRGFSGVSDSADAQIDAPIVGAGEQSVVQ